MKIEEKNPFVSIVIALKNEIGFIDKCLQSLLYQTYQKNSYEILIYDGNSTDGTKEYLEKIAKTNPQVRVFNNPKEIAAAGWNLGFVKSNAKYVVMMGGHTFVEPDFIEKNVQILENENVCCSGGRVTALGEDIKSQAIAFAFNHPFGVGDARYRYAQEKCQVETVNYGMYRKSVVDRIGPINEEIKRGEDWEYNYRIVQKFGKMVYSPEIKSHYYSRSGFGKLWKRQFDAGRYKLDIIKKYPGSMLLRHLIPFIFSLSLLILPLLTLLGLSPIYFFLLFAIYLFINFLFTLQISSKTSIKYLPYLPLAFFIMQFSYGLGFLAGIPKLFEKKMSPKI